MKNIGIYIFSPSWSRLPAGDRYLLITRIHELQAYTEETYTVNAKLAINRINKSQTRTPVEIFVCHWWSRAATVGMFLNHSPYPSPYKL